jgi:hypothetical protein
MAGLNQDDIRPRLLLDYRIVSGMHSPLMKVAAYRNVYDLRKRRNPITSEDEGHLATHYLVDYNIKTLVSRGGYSNSTTVYVDVLANTNYPFEEPVCWVVESKIPWSPHFRKEDGWVCLGELWRQSQGAMLLGQLLVHIAKLLNFDEEPRDNYVGFNGEAIDYWKNVLGYKPITINLPYPQLPLHLLYATPAEPERKVFVRKSVGVAGGVPQQPAPLTGGSGFRKKTIGKIPI